MIVTSPRTNGFACVLLGSLSMACGGIIATDATSASGGTSSVSSSTDSAASAMTAVGTAPHTSTIVTWPDTATATGVNTQSALLTYVGTTGMYTGRLTGSLTGTNSAVLTTSSVGSGTGTYTFVFSDTQTFTGSGTSSLTNTQSVTSTGTFVQTDAGTDAGSCTELDGGTLPPASSIIGFRLESEHCQDRPPRVSIVSDDPSKVQALYDLTTTKLTTGDLGFYSGNIGSYYALTFELASGRTLKVESDGTVITLEGTSCKQLLRDEYFSTIASVLSVDIHTLVANDCHEEVAWMDYCEYGAYDADAGVPDGGYPHAGLCIW
jgi:hypothetical protein